ncbi:hypothetical protein OS493_010931 [Desmophyllum pertusum]|uniref:Uncharacterized protein n=1 Tax=Desmophyllum pertusum TaxID=174260 RepID=A0A9X0CY30_9CNID|nr:hypothetical protein OS493_010931 [Desmophyllum pertusum]
MNQHYTSLPRFCSSSPRPSADESSGVETGYECIDLSFAQHAEPKKQKKKIDRCTRFGRWLRRLCCIPRENKDAG